MNSTTANSLVIIGWGMTVFLVYSLLSGPFDGHMCETTCFSMLYWGALVTAVLSTVLCAMQAFKANSGLLVKLGLLLGLLLTAKLVGIMVIGTIAL